VTHWHHFIHRSATLALVRLFISHRSVDPWLGWVSSDFVHEIDGKDSITGSCDLSSESCDTRKPNQDHNFSKSKGHSHSHSEMSKDLSSCQFLIRQSWKEAAAFLLQPPGSASDIELKSDGLRDSVMVVRFLFDSQQQCHGEVEGEEEDEGGGVKLSHECFQTILEFFPVSLQSMGPQMILQPLPSPNTRV
jgi:hypothetical protein